MILSLWAGMTSPNAPFLHHHALRVRKAPTRSEAMLWNALRDRRWLGVKFRRQHVVDRFIVDFVALGHRLVIEVDGPVHEALCARDEARDRSLAALGFRVLRVATRDIERTLPYVLDAIAHAL